MSEAAKKPMSLRLLRRIMSAKGPSALGQRKQDPHKALERLERWSARATLAILLGIVGEIAALWINPHTRSERIWGTFNDLLIAGGLIVEYLVILRAIVATGEANRESDEKVADAKKIAAQATQAAAEARERTAEIEKLTAWRHVSAEARATIADAIRPHAATLDLQLEFENGSPEAFSYAREIGTLFRGSGVEKIQFLGNSYIFGHVFGLKIGISPDDALSSIANAFEHAGLEPSIVRENISTHRPSGQTPPNLYIFVGAKSPPVFDFSGTAPGKSNI